MAIEDSDMGQEDKEIKIHTIRKRNKIQIYSNSKCNKAEECGGKGAVELIK